jgi:hypothetical protein
VRGIALNAHAAAATVALLPPPKFVVEEFLADRHARWNATEQRHQGFAVALTGCRESEHRC